MKYVTIIKDSADTYEIRYVESPSVVVKVIGGIFEHDLLKFIKDRFDKSDNDGYSSKCFRCNDNGCPACDEIRSGSSYNPEPY